MPNDGSSWAQNGNCDKAQSHDEAQLYVKRSAEATASVYRNTPRSNRGYAGRSWRSATIMRHFLGSAPKFVRVQALRVVRNLAFEFSVDSLGAPEFKYKHSRLLLRGLASLVTVVSVLRQLLTQIHPTAYLERTSPPSCFHQPLDLQRGDT
jgi:hypothetical protein